MKFRVLRYALLLTAIFGIVFLLRAALPTVATGTWVAVGNMAAARSGACSAALSDGRLLISGGADANGPTATADLFSTTGSWSGAGSLNSPRSRQSCAVLQDGRVLVAGGTSSGSGIINSAELYDPTANAWTQAGNMIDARSGATTSVLQDGRVLIAGGQGPGGALNTLEIFDPTSGTFSNAGTMSTSRQDHAAAVLSDGRVLIAGGFDGTNPLASSDIFDPSSGTLSAGPNLATARYAHSATTLLNGRVAVIGGAGAGTNGTVDLASAEIFDPSTGAFTTASATLTTAREGHQAFLLPKNNSVLIVGGSSSGTPVAASELFTPQASSSNGAWTYATAPTGSNVTPRSAATGSPMQQDGLLLAAGGTDASGNTLASTELYAFPTVKTDQADYPPGATVNITGSGFTPGEPVTITLVESPLFDTHGPYTVTAQQDGTISDSSFTTDLHDVNVRFWLSALGSKSGSQALNTFTDAAGDTPTNSVSCTPNTVTAGTPISCSATSDNSAGANGAPQGIMTFSYNGPGGTFTFSPTQCTLAQVGSTKLSNCSVTLTANAVMANGKVQANFNSNDTNLWKNGNPGSFNVTVNAGGFSQLQLLAPGETAAPGTATGKTGTPTAHTAGSAFNVTVNAVDPNWNLVSSTNTVHITSSDSNVTLPANAALVGGTQTFSVTLKTAPSQTITASDFTDGTKTSSISPAIPVNAAAANKLIFFQQPTDTNVGATITPAITVQVQDTFGNVVTISSASTTLSIKTGTGTSGAVLACTTGLSHNASSGVATFPDCNITKGGTTYQLHAASGTLAAADSSQFNIISPITKLGFTTGSVTGVINQCRGPISVQTQNSGGTGINPSTAVQVDLSITSGGTGAFFSDISCNAGITTVSIPTSANSVNFFFEGTSAGSPVVQAADRAGALSPATQTETINQATVTATVTANNKVYDATTLAAQNACTLAGVSAGDAGNVTCSASTLAFADKNVGTGKTVNVSGIALSGTARGNYQLGSTTTTTTANITARAVTVTAAANTKNYDGTTSASATPTITSGTLASGDTANFAEAYSSKNVGTGLALNPSGAINDGNGGNNYAVTFVSSSNGTITARPITVTATPNTKSYDGTTFASAGPTITSGSLVTGDSANFTEAYTTKNAGSGLTLVPTGSVSDGNSGNNYAVTLVNNTTGVIMARAITVTATSDTKAYDGTTSSSGTPTITSGTLATGDTASFTQVFDSKNAGPRTLTASGSVNDGNAGKNYTITLKTANGTITARPITVTAATNTKTYDGTASAAAIPMIGSGTLVSGDTASFTEVYSSKNTGIGLTLIPSGALSDGNAGNNYAVTLVNNTTGVINTATVTPSITAFDKIYDGTTTATLASQTLSGAISGDVVTLNVGAANFSDANAGSGKTVTATGLSLSGASAGNYQLLSTTATATANITTATPAVTVSGGPFPYDGMPHTASAFAVGVGGVVVPGFFVFTYTPASDTTVPVNAGSYTVNAAFTSTNANYGGSVGGGTIVINQAQLSLTAADASRPFGQANPSLTGTLTGVVAGDGIRATYASAATVTTAAGVYGPADPNAIVPTLLDPNNKLSNYNVTSTNGTLTITAIPLLVIANDKTRTFGAADPAFDAQYFSFVNGDTAASSLTGSLSCTPSNGSDTAGSYAIHCGGLSSNNYTLTFVDGTLTVTDPLNTIAVTPNPAPVIYGDSTPFAARGTFASSASRTLGNAGGASYPLPDLSIARTGAAGTEAQGKLYTIGGTITGSISNTVEVYDPTNNSWGSAANLNNARTSARAASVAGKVYVFGGCSDIACSSLVATPEVYDSNSNIWATVSSGGFTPRRSMAVGVIGGKIYVAGGNDNAGNPLGVVEVYDPGTDTWSSTAPLKTNLGPASGGVVNGTFYVVGISGGKAEVEAFNGTSWSTVNSGTQSLSDAGAAVLNNVIYVIDGATIHAYDPVARNWTDKTSLNTARLQPEPVTIGNLIYVAGDTASSATDPNAVESFASDEAQWSSSDTAVSAIDQMGKASALKVGGATITATSIISPSISGSTLLTVSPAKVTPAIVVSGKIYDGTKAATVTSCTVSPVVRSDDVACSVGTANFSDKNAGAGKTVTATGITLTGNSASNYMLSSNTATTAADISARPLTVVATGVNKVYDGATSATVTLSDNRVTGDVFTDSYASATFPNKNVGNGKIVSVSGISISGADAGNYTFNATATTTANITPRTLTVTATGVNKVYDGTTSATVTVSTDKLAGDYVNVGYASATFADKNVANGKTVTVGGVSITGGADAGNYTLNGVTQIVTTANITPRPLTVSATGTNKQYDGTTVATVTLADNRVTGDLFTDSYASATFLDKNVGDSKTVNVTGISISGADAGNYTFNPTAAATANITSRPLTVTATGMNKQYDGTTAATVTLADNRVTGDLFTDGHASATFSDKNVGNGKAVNVSGISISGTDAGNYTFNPAAATTANITCRPLTATATGVNKQYDGTTATTVALADNRVTGDVFTDSYASATFSDKNVGNGKAVNVSGISISGPDAANYTFNTTAMTTANITSRTLTVTATGVNKVYDGTTTATGTLSSDKLMGDYVNVGYTSASFADKNVANGLMVTVSGVSITGGADAGNYTLNGVTQIATTANITPATLTLTVTGASGAYNAQPYTAACSVATGLVNGDSVTLTITYSSVTAPVIVGSYTATCTSSGNSNYQTATGQASITITPAITTTSLVSSGSPSNWMQVVTLTATVSASNTTPTGTVSFYNAAAGANCSSLATSTLLGKEPLSTTGSGQQASTSTPSLPVGPGNLTGTDTILACYNSDSTDPNFNANFSSSSGAFTQTVNPAPIASLSPASLSFGNQQGGTTSGTQTVTVSNLTGTAPLIITSITFTGTNPNYFTQTNNCTSVAIGGSCTINVAFAPPLSATGVATANLVVTDNDKNVSGSKQFSSVTGAGTSSISSLGSLSTYAIFATANGCSSLNVSGNGTVDSFNSNLGPYSSSHLSSGGNVGTNGNVTLGGNPVVYGTAASPFGGTGNCSSKTMTGYSISGGAEATAGPTVLPQAQSYPAPPAPSPAPPTTTQDISGSCGSILGCSNNGSKNVMLAAGSYGNLSVSGGTTVNVSGGTYNLNSLTLSGNSTLVVTSGTGPVTINLAGKSITGGNTVLDLSGGVMSNASGLASNLQFYYAGFQPIKLSGGTGSYAVVYSPNAPINVSGGAHFYGAMVGSTVNSSGGTAIHYDANLPNIQPGNYIWFSSAALNVQGLPASGSVKVYVTNASISFPSTATQCTVPLDLTGKCTLPVPNAVLTFSSTASTASATWDATNLRWSTLVPTNGSTTIQAHTFLDGFAYLVPSGGFPTGIQNVTFSAAFSTSTTGISFNWQWGAAVYTPPFTSNYSSLTVNPVEGSDPAGTPENYKSNLIFGATGPGYTGLYVGTAGVVPTIAEASVSPSSLDFTNGGTLGQTVGTTSGQMTAVLTNNQTGSLTISSIQLTGTNPGDFTESDNCPISPLTLAGGGSCTIIVTFEPTATGKRTAKIAVNDGANNSPQTVFLKGTGH